MIETNEIGIANKYIYHECRLHQMDKKQDFCKIGKGRDNFGNHQEFDYILIIDGHGDPYTYSLFFDPMLNSMDFSVLLGTENPVDTIVKYIEKQTSIDIVHLGTPRMLSVGSTLSIAKIYYDSQKIRVVCYNVGDSRIRIFNNDKPVYVSNPHIISSTSENERLMSKFQDGSAIIHEDSHFELINSSTIRLSKCNRIIFYYGKHMQASLIPTQCLGHLGITGLDPEVYTGEFDANNKIRIIVYSDGVDDMLCNNLQEDENLMMFQSCDEIINKVVERWNFSWTIEDMIDLDDETECNSESPLINETMAFQKGDDCSVAIWDNYSLL